MISLILFLSPIVVSVREVFRYWAAVTASSFWGAFFIESNLIRNTLKTYWEMKLNSFDTIENIHVNCFEMYFDSASFSWRWTGTTVIHTKLTQRWSYRNVFSVFFQFKFHFFHYWFILTSLGVFNFNCDGKINSNNSWRMYISVCSQLKVAFLHWLFTSIKMMQRYNAFEFGWWLHFCEFVFCLK